MSSPSPPLCPALARQEAVVIAGEETASPSAGGPSLATLPGSTLGSTHALAEPGTGSTGQQHVTADIRCPVCTLRPPCLHHASVVDLAVSIALKAQEQGVDPEAAGQQQAQGQRGGEQSPEGRFEKAKQGETWAAGPRGGPHGQGEESKEGYIPAWRARFVFCLGLGLGATGLWLILLNSGSL